jgi:hypothetical protein
LASKTKGRPRAAEVETTAEDIRFLGRFQGTPGLGYTDWSRGGVFAFYSPLEILLRRGGFVKPGGKKSFSPPRSLRKPQKDAKKFPDFWTSYLGMARVYSAQGDFDNAVKEIKLSMTGAPDANKTALEGLAKRLQAKEDINR